MMNSKILNRRTRMGLRTAVLLVLLMALNFMTQAAPGSTQKPVAAIPSEPKATSVLVQSDHPVGRHLFGDWYAVQVTAADPSEALNVAQQMPHVLAVEPDATLKLHQADCTLPEWYIENCGQFGNAESVDVDTDAWEAWQVLRTVPSLSVIRIALLDSGVNKYHRRFKDVTFYTVQKLVNDDRSIGDVYGHGTAVAGVITAMLPEPTWYELGSYRVYDEYGLALYSDLISGLAAAVADGVKIINFSGGGAVPSTAIYEFLASHPDVLFVCSAGNSGEPLPEYPAQYHDLPNVISVAAIDQAGALTPWTNRGALLAAPGEHIFTSLCGCEVEPMTICGPTGYGFLSGTSLSAPIVSAVCAGRMLMHPDETPAQVRQKLLTSVDVNSLYSEALLSRGRTNFQKLVQLP